MVDANNDAAASFVPVPLSDPLRERHAGEFLGAVAVPDVHFSVEMEDVAARADIDAAEGFAVDDGESTSTCE
jgi:hypothetical protein